MSSDGVGRLPLLDFPLLASFDTVSRRLFLLGTQNPAPTTLTQRLQRLQPRQEKLGDHNRVYFLPTTQSGTVQWSCRADFEVQYTLQECH